MIKLNRIGKSFWSTFKGGCFWVWKKALGIRNVEGYKCPICGSIRTEWYYYPIPNPIKYSDIAEDDGICEKCGIKMDPVYIETDWFRIRRVLLVDIVSPRHFNYRSIIHMTDNTTTIEELLAVIDWEGWEPERTEIERRLREFDRQKILSELVPGLVEALGNTFKAHKSRPMKTSACPFCLDKKFDDAGCFSFPEHGSKACPWIAIKKTLIEARRVLDASKIDTSDVLATEQPDPLLQKLVKALEWALDVLNTIQPSMSVSDKDLEMLKQGNVTLAAAQETIGIKNGKIR